MDHIFCFGNRKFSAQSGCALLLTLYVDEMSLIAQKQGVKVHVYADDTTFYIDFKPSNEYSITVDKPKLCIDGVKLGMLSNFFKLNLDKTQIIFLRKTYPY